MRTDLTTEERSIVRTTGELRHDLNRLLEACTYRDYTIHITQYGEEAAVLIGHVTYERLRRQAHAHSTKSDTTPMPRTTATPPTSPAGSDQPEEEARNDHQTQREMTPKT